MKYPAVRAVFEQGIAFNFSSDHGEAEVGLGYRFQVDQPGWIVQAGWIQNTDDHGAHAAWLIDADHQVVKVAAWTGSSVGGADAPWSWVWRNLKPGWLVTPGVVYEWMVWRQHGSLYAYKPNVLDTTPIVDGPVTILNNNFDGSSSAGLFQYGQPFTSDLVRAEGTLYGVDFSFRL